MPKLFLSESGQTICEISGEQLSFLRKQLVDEDTRDREYFLDQDTLEMLKDQGCDATLLERLQAVLGEQEGVDIRWSV